MAVIRDGASISAQVKFFSFVRNERPPIATGCSLPSGPIWLKEVPIAERLPSVVTMNWRSIWWKIKTGEVVNACFKRMNEFSESSSHSSLVSDFFYFIVKGCCYFSVSLNKFTIVATHSEQGTQLSLIGWAREFLDSSNFIGVSWNSGGSDDVS